MDMDYLQETFRLQSEAKQYEEKMKKDVEEQCELLSLFIRPHLTADQNETLSKILESIIGDCSETSFNMGYNAAMQQFATGHVLTQPPKPFPQQ